MKILIPQIPGIAIGASGVPTAFCSSSTLDSVAPMKNPKLVTHRRFPVSIFSYIDCNVVWLGTLFGMSRNEVTPPLAAAHEPVYKSSFSG